MAPYIRPVRRSQLFCALLALALLWLPLAGADSKPAPALVPLATGLIPLDHALEVPAAAGAHLPDLTAATKVALARPPMASVQPIPQCRLSSMATSIGSQRTPLEVLRVRAPPGA